MARTMPAPCSGPSATTAPAHWKKRSHPTRFTNWCGNTQRRWVSRSGRTRCGQPPRPTRLITRPTLPRCRSGWVMPTSPPRGFTITARPGRRTVRPSKWPIRECSSSLSVSTGNWVFTLDFRRDILPTCLIASASGKASGSRRRRAPPWLELTALSTRRASKLPCFIDAVAPGVVWFATAPERKCRVKFADDPL